ncbi:MAG: TetR/AcrR family transcriptional regulator [Actinomycetota bacterium]|nr:TetR/AcrR family transcriptional regulator [Actinomycetota bacterium]
MARKEVRVRILEASKTVFEKKGYQKATVSDILDEAHVARATFYKYFPNKRQVLLELFQNFLNSLYRSTSNYMLDGQVLPGALAGRIRGSLVLFYSAFLGNRKLVSICFSQASGQDPGMFAIWDDFERKLVVLFRKVLERGVDQGVFRQIDTGIVARTMAMIFLQIPYRDIIQIGYSNLDIESVADELVRFAIEGIVRRQF